MATETELERMVIRLVGDGSSYQRMLAQAEKTTASTMKSIEQGTRSIGKKMSLFVTAPLTGIAALARSQTSEFNASLSQMVGLVGLSQETVDGFAVHIKNVAVEAGKSPVELANAMFFITSAGLRGEKALEALRISAMAASAGLGDTQDVADAVTSAMNAYGHGNLSATRATELLTAAVRAGKAEASQFAPQLGQLLPLTAAMGLGFEQVAGGLAFLTKTTGNASLAATGLKGVLRVLGGTTASIKGFDDIGTSIEKIQDMAKRDGIPKTLKHIRELTESKGKRLNEIFTDAEGLTAALQFTGAAAEDAVNVFKDVADSVGIVDEAFAAAAATTKFQWARVMAEFKVILLEVGEILMPISTEILDFTELGLKAWRSLTAETKKFLVITAAVAAAIGPVLIGFSTFVAVSGVVITQVGVVTGLFSGMLGPVASIARAVGLLIRSIPILGGIFATLTSPLFLAVAAITAIGVAIYKLASGKSLGQLWEDGSAKVQAFVAVVDGFFSNFQTNLDLLKTWAGGVWDLIREQATILWDGITEMVSDSAAEITKILEGMGIDVDGVWGTIKNAAKFAGKFIEDTIGISFKNAVGFLSNFGENFLLLFRYVGAGFEDLGRLIITVVGNYNNIIVAGIQFAATLYNLFFSKTLEAIAFFASQSASLISGALLVALTGNPLAIDAFIAKSKKTLQEGLAQLDLGPSFTKAITDGVDDISKSALDGFTSTLGDLPDFNLDIDARLKLPDFVTDPPEELEGLGKEADDAAKKSKKAIDQITKGAKGADAKVKIGIEGVEAVEKGSADALAHIKQYIDLKPSTFNTQDTEAGKFLGQVGQLKAPPSALGDGKSEQSVLKTLQLGGRRTESDLIPRGVDAIIKLSETFKLPPAPSLGLSDSTLGISPYDGMDLSEVVPTALIAELGREIVSSSTLSTSRLGGSGLGLGIDALSLATKTPTLAPEFDKTPHTIDGVGKGIEALVASNREMLELDKKRDADSAGLGISLGAALGGI